MLYGVKPYKSGLYTFYDHDIYKQLHEQYISLPQFQKDNGYSTFRSGKIYHSNKYDDFSWTDYLANKLYTKVFAKNKGFNINNKHSFRPITNPLEKLFNHKATSYGIDLIAKHGSIANNKPYFAAIGLVKPYLAFDCPVQFSDTLPQAIEPPKLLVNDLDDIGKEGNSMRRPDIAEEFKRHNK